MKISAAVGGSRGKQKHEVPGGTDDVAAAGTWVGQGALKDSSFSNKVQPHGVPASVGFQILCLERKRGGGSLDVHM